MKENNEIDYIAKHYRPGRFSVDEALRSIHPAITRKWSSFRIAASWMTVAVLSAAAAVLIHNDFFIDKKPAIAQEQTVTAPAEAVVRVIDFEETPLPIVIEKIREVYGVDIINVPVNTDEYILSLHYEGSATDLLETINDILGTDMTVKQ